MKNQSPAVIGRSVKKVPRAPSGSQFYLKHMITAESYQPKKPKYASDKGAKATFPYLNPYPVGS